MRPEIIECASESKRMDADISLKKPLIALAVLAVVIGGVLSIFASSNPDGLEWAMEKTAGTAELEASGGIFDGAAAVQETTAFLPDYGFADADEEAGPTGTSVSGIVGALITFALAAGTGVVISKVKKSKREGAAS